MKRLQHCKKFFLLLSCFITYPSFCYSSEYPQFNYLSTVIQSVITADKHPYLNKRIFLAYKQIVDDLYFVSPQHLQWLNKDDLNNQNIVAVLKLLSTAKQNGLEEEHYNFSTLRTQWQQLKGQPDVSLNQLATLDIAISINLFHFLSDLHFGRINPLTLAFNFVPNKNSSKFVPLILNAIQTNEIDKLANKVEPHHPSYRSLKTALLNYRQLNRVSSPNKTQYISSIHAGETAPQIITIRQQLKHQGIQTSNKNTASCLFDDDLLNSIKRFQIRHGLMDDGVIGKETIKALNTPLSKRVHQIELAMERFRWLPKRQTDSLVIVNIPAFQLWAYNTSDTNSSNMLNMKVIVGESAKSKSPVFTADMYYIEFSPYWNIPKSITVEEILPKLEENILYLEQQNMELVTGFHNNEIPVPYTEDTITQLKNGSLKVRQRPGRDNALGKVKFIFPNNHNVYLHDTPSHGLFNKPKRDLSHGCIRVEKPTELANFLLESKPGWNQKETLKAMQLQQPQQVRLKKSIPVIIFYSTALAVKDKIYFYNDIYDYDAKLNQALVKHSNKQKAHFSTLLSSN